MKANPKLISSLYASAFRHSALILAAGVISSALSCKADSVSGPEPARRVIEPITPPYVEARAGSTVEPSPAIILKDQRTGKPLAGVTVEFRAGPGSGSVEQRVTTTDASGIATAGKWQVGTRVGLFTLDAVVGGMKSGFNVRINPDVPARFFRADTILVGRAGEVIPFPAILVLDRFDNPTPGVPVTFTVAAGDGTLENSTGVTGPGGIVAAGPWRLGSTPGENALVASAEGIEPARFTAVGLDPATITRYTLDSVRQGTTVRSPQEVGVLQSTLDITAFDRCLCRSEVGFYIMDVAYSVQSAWEHSTRIAGQFKVEPPLLRLLGRVIDSAAIDQGRIEIDIERNDGDWIWTETWIYRATTPP